MTKISCEAARDEMLIADLAELRGEGDSELVVHLRSCAECGARAATLLRAQSEMADGLAVLKADLQVLPLRRKHTTWRWVPLPLAAAAALALLLMRPQREVLPNVDAVARLMFRETPVVAPPAGKQAMVIEKTDMTIVWLYHEETT